MAQRRCCCEKLCPPVCRDTQLRVVFTGIVEGGSCGQCADLNDPGGFVLTYDAILTDDVFLPGQNACVWSYYFDPPLCNIGSTYIDVITAQAGFADITGALTVSIWLNGSPPLASEMMLFYFGDHGTPTCSDGYSDTSDTFYEGGYYSTCTSVFGGHTTATLEKL